MERAVCPLGGGDTCRNEEGMEGFGFVISQSREPLGDLVGGRCDGMEKAVCALGGGDTRRNEKGMEGFRIVISPSWELSRDLVGGKCNGMERAICPLEQLHRLGHNCAKWKKWLILHNLSKKTPTPACA